MPSQKGRYFADDIFECIFLNENVKNSIKISLKFVSRGTIKNILALVQMMPLAPNRRQAIIRNNDGLGCRHIWSLDLNKLIQSNYIA